MTLTRDADDIIAREVEGFLYDAPEDNNSTRFGVFWKTLGPASQVADALTTIISVHKHKGKIVEGNALMAPLVHGGIYGQAAFIGLKLGLGAGMAVAGAKLAKSGHTTSAKVATAIGSSLGFGAALYNIRLSQRTH